MYQINLVEYNEILEYDGKPYEMLLNPISREQFLELEAKLISYIREESRANYLGYYLARDIAKNLAPFKLDGSQVFVAIRFIGGSLDPDLSNLGEDHDIEIYHISFLEESI